MINHKIYPSVYKGKKKHWYNRYLHYYRYRLMRLQGNPYKLARGFAVAVFAGCFPLFGLQMILAILLAVVWRGNKFAAVTGTWISNPFTYVPIFWFNFKLGKFILHSGGDETAINQIEFNWDSWQNLAGAGLEILTTLFVGSFLVGIIVGILTYSLSLKMLKSRKKELKKQ